MVSSDTSTSTTVGAMITCSAGPPVGEDIDISSDEIVGVIRELLEAPVAAGIDGVGEQSLADGAAKEGVNDALIASPLIVGMIGVDADVIHDGGVVDAPLRVGIGCCHAGGGWDAVVGGCCGKGYIDGDN